MKINIGNRYLIFVVLLVFIFGLFVLNIKNNCIKKYLFENGIQIDRSHPYSLIVSNNPTKEEVEILSDINTSFRSEVCLKQINTNKDGREFILFIKTRILTGSQYCVDDEYTLKTTINNEGIILRDKLNYQQNQYDC